MPGRWVDPPEGEVEPEEGKGQDTEEEEEDLVEEDASTSSDNSRMYTTIIHALFTQKNLRGVYTQYTQVQGMEHVHLQSGN